MPYVTDDDSKAVQRITEIEQQLQEAKAKFERWLAAACTLTTAAELAQREQEGKILTDRLQALATTLELQRALASPTLHAQERALAKASPKKMKDFGYRPVTVQFLGGLEAEVLARYWCRSQARADKGKGGYFGLTLLGVCDRTTPALASEVAQLAAALMFLMLKQRDAVGLVAFDEKIRTYVPPKSASVHLHALLSTLSAVTPAARTHAGTALHEMAERIKRRGLIILLSDLWEDPSSVLTGLKHFRHRKHEVIVFHILDPTERDFTFPEEAQFKDMETGEEISTLPWQIRSEYQRTMKAHVERYKRECRQSFVDYVLIDTSVPYDYALFSYLAKRARLY